MTGDSTRQSRLIQHPGLKAAGREVLRGYEGEDSSQEGEGGNVQQEVLLTKVALLHM